MSIRTHTCGALRKAHIGEDVTLCGWVTATRDHGGILFIDISDRYGTVQVVFDPTRDAELYEQAARLGQQDVVSISGKVAARPEDMVNSTMPTGEIELFATMLTVFNECERLPFEPAEADSVSELKRLQYRYLDLRRPEMRHNLMFRYRVIKDIRDYLAALDFVEVETPYLTKSTPEGARDYIVPSRTYPGKFYALPQSPQLFKQLLMVAGFDRYFQLARCFRDEDLRADRQPEFTQLDIELSFATEEDIFTLIEELIAQVLKNCCDTELSLPFRRIRYEDALALYGTDKPDIRFGMPLVDVTETLTGTGFRVLENTIGAGGKIKGICVKGRQYSRRETDEFTAFVKQFGAGGLLSFKCTGSGLQSPVAKFLTKEQLDKIEEQLNAKKGDTIFLVADAPKVVHRALDELRLRLGTKLGLRSEPRYSFCWVIEPPLFELDEQDNITPTHHPFTAPHEEDIDKLTTNPLSVRARAYDLTFNGVEIFGGSVRIHKRELQNQIFDILSIDKQRAKERFGFFLDALRYGAPPHAGIAGGIERFVAELLGLDSIRDVIPFPKTTSAACPLTGAPAEAETDQLAELKIRVETGKQGIS